MTTEIYGSVLNYAAAVNRTLTDANLVTHTDADGNISYLNIQIVDAEEPTLDMRLQVNDSGEGFSLFVGTVGLDAVVSPDLEDATYLSNAVTRAISERKSDYVNIFSAAHTAYIRGERSPLLDAVLNLARSYGYLD